MNSRLEALVKRGYNIDDVKRLALFMDEELEYASNFAFKHISRSCSSVENPNCIFIGGQPGSGKTVMSMNLKNEIQNAVEIGIDNYRCYHPRYLEIEDCIRNHWKDRTETINDTPGNDIADFTHFFAGVMTDKLIEMAKDNKYNMILEWGMREPIAPLSCMRTLKKNGYNNIVLFVATNKELSYKACELRYNIMKNSNRIIRKVPKDFHDLSVATLPASMDTICEVGYKENLIDYMGIITRNNSIVWEKKDDVLPGQTYYNCLNDKSYINSTNNNVALAQKINKKELEMLKEHIICISPEIFNMSKGITL